MPRPDSYIVRFYNRIEKKRGKNKARVAAASKMLRVIFHMLKENRDGNHDSQGGPRLRRTR